MNALAEAVARHQAGDRVAARTLYERVLAEDPANADANHLMGVLAAQAGDDRVAVAHMERALAVEPHSAVFLSNYGASLRRLRRLEQAVSVLTLATGLAPDAADAQINLGNALLDLGRPEAVAAYERATALAPRSRNAWCGLGRALLLQNDPVTAAIAFHHALGLDPADARAHRGLAEILLGGRRWAEALAHADLSLEANADNPQAHEARGLALYELNRFEEAASAFSAAAARNPGSAPAHANLGRALQRLGQSGKAEMALRRAIASDPSFAEAQDGLGDILMERGEPQEALERFTEALRLAPDHVPFRFNRANALCRLGRHEDAIGEYDKALVARPEWGEVHLNRGVALQALGRLAEAAQACEDAAQTMPDAFEPSNNLGDLLLMQGRHAEARRAFEIAGANARRARSPRTAAVHSNLLLAMNYDAGVDCEALFAAHRAWDAEHGAGHAMRSHRNDRTPSRPLRVGYVSPDFDSHAMAFFLTPIFESHDAGAFEVHGYAEVEKPDAVTTSLSAEAKVWRSTVGWSDDEVAEMVRADGIDILVDLAGHTGGNRLGVFARKPAPVQASYLGYATTTGLAAMDWRISDPFLTPEDRRERFTESVHALASCFLCYRPPAEAPDVVATPASRNGHVTFGCFNNTAKIGEELIALWAALLEMLPGTRLLLKTKALNDAGTRERIATLFRRHGVGSRVELRGHSPTTAEHLAAYGEVDIALDTFPYGGGTTTVEALWMGVPVVSLAGDRSSARFGLSILSSLGLGTLAASDPRGYMVRAAELASDIGRLERLRAAGRARFLASPLSDGPAFTRGLEDAYRTLWRAWCAQP
jgi:protein O-GlcNAc transferase